MRKLFWYPLAALAYCALVANMLYENTSKLFYNTFHRHKKPISWNPFANPYITDMDETESFYHD